MFRKAVWVFALAILFHAPAAHACSCSREQSAKFVAERVSLMFKGEVVSTEVLAPGAVPEIYARASRTDLKITEILKGSPRDSVVVYSDADGGACGVEFSKMTGKAFVVALEEKNGRFFADYCSFMYVNLEDNPRRPRR